MGNYIFNTDKKSGPDLKVTNEELVNILEKYKQKIQTESYTFEEFMRVFSLYLFDKDILHTNEEFTDEQIVQYFTLGWYISQHNE